MDTTTFSPKEAADIIGVSESTVKRWVDAGHIPVHRTLGGHRRIAIVDLVRFVREEGMPVVRPDLLGIEAAPRGEGREFSDRSFYDALLRGDGLAARRGLAGAFVEGRPLAELVDEVVAPAFDRLGTLWHHGDEGIFLEHRSVTICLEALHHISLLIPDRNGTTPVLVGGAPTGDPYILPTLSAALSLRDAGYLTVHLGPETPPSSFLHAVAQHRPRLAWLSMTALQRTSVLSAYLEELATGLRAEGVPLLVGGQAARQLKGAPPVGVTMLTGMRDLVDHVREVLSG